MSSSHQILGTTVDIPVKVRNARCFMAGFSASAEKVAAAIAHTGLEPVTLPRGLDIPRSLNPLKLLESRTLCLLLFVDYIDNDLGPYNEFGVAIPVKSPPGVTPPALGDGDGESTEGKIDMSSILIHELPVDGEFTLAAGRGIWGFPKILADFDVDHDARKPHGKVSADGKLIADLTIGRGVKTPGESKPVTFHAFSHIDDTTRMIPWDFDSMADVTGRVGGASLKLGNHPIAEELRGFDLSKHALMTTVVGKVEMTFNDATVLD